jgi:hypothetical protein
MQASRSSAATRRCASVVPDSIPEKSISGTESKSGRFSLAAAIGEAALDADAGALCITISSLHKCYAGL